MSRRRPLIWLLVLMISWPGGIRAQTVQPQEAAAIRGVIAEQLAAFRRDDAKAAYGLAAPAIREAFADADIFMAMVRRAYPQIFRARSSRFAEPVSAGAIVWQMVTITGDDGIAIDALYQMQKQPGGNWRISGVQARPAKGNRI